MFNKTLNFNLNKILENEVGMTSKRWIFALIFVLKAWFAYNRYCRKDHLCRLKRAPRGQTTTDASEAILAINCFPLNRMHRIIVMVKKTGTSHRLSPALGTATLPEPKGTFFSLFK